MSGYRDDLDAAQTRIAQLEAEVAELRAQLGQTPAQQTRLAELQQRRADALDALRGAERGARRMFVLAVTLGVVAAVAFVGTIANMGRSGHPLNAAIVGFVAVALVVGGVTWIGRAIRNAYATDLRALDQQIAELSTQAERVRVSAPHARVESDTDATADAEADVGADEENEDGGRRHGNSRPR